jgi:hypothetical protein
MNSEIVLVLSGTQMSGLRYNVDREWAMEATMEDITDLMKEIMIDLAKKYGMYILLEVAKNVDLHIHYPYDKDSKEIYVCACME